MVPVSGELAVAVPALAAVLRHVEATSLLVQPLVVTQSLAVVAVAEAGALSAVSAVVVEAVVVAAVTAAPRATVLLLQPQRRLLAATRRASRLLCRRSRLSPTVAGKRNLSAPRNRFVKIRYERTDGRVCVIDKKG